MTGHRTYYGDEKFCATDYWITKLPRTAGMRAKTDAPIVPVYKLSLLRRVALKWRNV